MLVKLQYKRKDEKERTKKEEKNFSIHLIAGAGGGHLVSFSFYGESTST